MIIKCYWCIYQWNQNKLQNHIIYVLFYFDNVKGEFLWGKDEKVLQIRPPAICALADRGSLHWSYVNAKQHMNSNPGKHGSRRRIREKSILTTFKWKVCVLNDIQLKWYLHHCVGLKLNFQVIYLFWCLARPVRCFWEVFAIHGTTFRYARLVEKIGALWSRSVHVNTKTRGQTLLNIH